MDNIAILVLLFVGLVGTPHQGVHQTSQAEEDWPFSFCLTISFLPLLLFESSQRWLRKEQPRTTVEMQEFFRVLA